MRGVMVTNDGYHRSTCTHERWCDEGQLVTGPNTVGQDLKTLGNMQIWKCFENLPVPIQRTAKKNFKLLKDNPSHPSLHFKKVGKFWSARVGIDHRALAVENDVDFI